LRVLGEPASKQRRRVIKLWSVIGLLFTAAILASIPVSPQMTQRGVELGVDQVQAVTYGRYRRVTRRAYRAGPYAARPGYYYYGARSYYYGGYGSYGGYWGQPVGGGGGQGYAGGGYLGPPGYYPARLIGVGF
jgi:hypothetical protein